MIITVNLNQRLLIGHQPFDYEKMTGFAENGAVNISEQPVITAPAILGTLLIT
jgi:hypothetical protein